MLFAAELLRDSGLEALAEPGEPAVQANGHRRREGRGRRLEDLPRVEVVHQVPEAERLCPECGKPRVHIGEERSRQLDYKPASLFVVEHVREKLACKECEAHVTVAEKPRQPIEKGLPGPGLLAQVVVSKYGDHLPLYRMERIFGRHGLELSRSTTCDWMGRCATLLGPLHELMGTEVRSSKVIHTDDTPVPVQEKGAGKTKTGRLWVYVGDEAHPYTVFDYTASHKRDGPARWLRPFEGYLQADAFAGYDGIYLEASADGGPRVIEVACMAHARRKFHEARTSASAPAHVALARIGQLYDVERRAKDLSAEDRLALRRAESRPLLEAFRQWLDQQAAQSLPKSPIRQAIDYACSNWAALCRYTEDGDLDIDNNAAENAVRGVAIGRKNYLFYGSDNGGRTAAVLYSMVRTCERHGIDPFEYLRDVIGRISDHPKSRLGELLPDRWKAARADRPQAASAT
jgi:transposase